VADGGPKAGCGRRRAGVLLAFIGDSNAITVAGRGRAGVAEAPVREGIVGLKKSVSLLELSTRLLGECSCEMDGFRVRTRDLPSSRLPRERADTLLACVMRCRALGDAIGDGVVDEVRERVVGKATLEVVDLRFAFVAECARNSD
jgi:hypothetical protein